MDKCKYCGGENLITESKGQHIGLYCLDCKGKDGGPKWLKWVGRNETGEVASEAQEKYARNLLNAWAVSKQPLLASEAGAIIQGLKGRWSNG